MHWWMEIKNDLRALWPDWRGLSERLRREWKRALGVAAIFAGLYALGAVMPVGYDWRNFFSQNIIPPYFMPWTGVILSLLNWPLLFAVSVLALVWRARRYQASPLTLALALGSLPVIWALLFLSNIDGLTVLGVMLLPWGAPLVLLKPQVAGFALLAHRRWWIATGLWLVISVAVWGWWPGRIGLVMNDPNWRADWPQDITLYPWGLLIALPLMWFSRGDEDLMMAAGSLGTPHIFPYHFIVLMPALARMTWPWRIAAWLLTWMPVLANWLGPIGWHFGNLASVTFWFGIYLNKRAQGR
jgi:hypothetical protein